MPPPPPELVPPTAVSCPLLTKYGGDEAVALIGRFAAAVGEVKAVEADRQLAPLLLAGQFNDPIQLLARARDLMTRRRYTVGCVGITQAGKSTVVNNVLGEEVCKPGSGDATSSQPSRVSYADRRTLDVEYLTPGRFAARREKLCEAVGLATPGDDRELLPLLERPDDFRAIEGPDRPRLREDLAYLRSFLTARQRHPNLVTDPPKVLADQPYSARYTYTTHTPDAPRPEVLLVREARFRIDNRQIPEDLELCDLPGLDSKRTVDDVVTWEYLPDLDGTFLFVNVAGNLLTEGMQRILLKLRDAFRGAVQGRAWVIFNKMDTLTGDHFRQGHRDNVFATIGRFLELVGVPESQVCFCSKKLWDAAAQQPTKTADPEFAARTLSQPAESPVPAACPPGLRPAWQELLRDGGISHVRRLMFDEVPSSLAAQIRRDVTRLIEEFSEGFAGRVAAARRRLTMDHSELQAAFTCRTVVQHLLVALGPRLDGAPILIQEGERLRRALAELFDSGSTTELLSNLSAAELARQFRTHARVLNERLRLEVSGEMLERVYEVVGQRLEGLPPVPVGPARQTCKEEWSRFGIEDRADESWRAALPGFDSEDLRRWLARPGGDGIDAAGYVALMRDKIDAAVRQTVHLVRTRLRARLGSIDRELDALTGERPAAT